MRVALLDYGVGNMHSLRKALELSGADVDVVTEPPGLAAAKAVVLPGVGAFGAAMERLEPFREPLLAALERGVPALAVCLGMQLLFEGSEESPGVRGLGFLRGPVRRFPARVGKVPLIGWTPVRATTAAAEDPVVRPGESPFYYFVHSYVCEPRDPVTLATASYGVEFPALVRRRNTWGAQFHPEKSSADGLALLRRWVAFAAAHAPEDA